MNADFSYSALKTALKEMPDLKAEDMYALIPEEDRQQLKDAFYGHISDAISQTCKKVYFNAIAGGYSGEKFSYDEEKEFKVELIDMPENKAPRLRAFTYTIYKEPYVGFWHSAHYMQEYDGSKNPADRMFSVKHLGTCQQITGNLNHGDKALRGVFDTINSGLFKRFCNPESIMGLRFLKPEDVLNFDQLARETLEKFVDIKVSTHHSVSVVLEKDAATQSYLIAPSTLTQGGGLGTITTRITQDESRFKLDRGGSY